MARLFPPARLPGWVPEAARLYLLHTVDGVPLRALARTAGLHASTVLRQVRRIEGRRDDPLVDEALARLGRFHPVPAPAGATGPRPVETDPVALTLDPGKETARMSAPLIPNRLLAEGPAPGPDDATILREARRILRRLTESGAVLVIAPDMARAVVLREAGDGSQTRTAVLDRAVAQAFALRDWIGCAHAGRVRMYRITPAGRVALRRMLADAEAGAAPDPGAERPGPFAAQHGEHVASTGPDGSTRLRCNLAESPVAQLARRRDKAGQPFLSPAQVAAAERLREDFEVAQMGPRVAQNWERFMTGPERGTMGSGRGPGGGSSAARERVAAALRDLGPGLGDVALRCCCFLEGLEAAEQRMGWSARSGKIVLRIALTRLARHFDELGERGKLIG